MKILALDLGKFKTASDISEGHDCGWVALTIRAETCVPLHPRAGTRPVRRHV